jgi:molybdopterin converting factor small subunit
MRVEFFGIYRTIANGKNIEVKSGRNLTVRDILQTVCTRVPLLMNELFNEHGDLYPYIPVYINGRNPRLLEAGLNTLLQPEDVVSLFSPISSGRVNVEVLTEKSK